MESGGLDGGGGVSWIWNGGGSELDMEWGGGGGVRGSDGG